jgi:hypothetical protein
MAARIKVKFLDGPTYKSMNEARKAAVLAFPGYQDIKPGEWPIELKELNASFIPPGSLWEMPWIFDPEADASKLKARIKASQAADYDGYLSAGYYQTHASYRPPLCVKLPNHSDWVVDSKSSNGPGWLVTHTPPLYSDLTCAPSILVPGYHGFLTNGEFTPDVERPNNPYGIPSWRL